MKLKRRYIPLAMLVVGLVTTALAVPLINFHTQNIGEGVSPVVSPADNGAGNFVLDSNNPDYVIGVKVSFDKDLQSGTTIYVKIYNSTPTYNTVGGKNIPVPMAIGQVTLSDNLTAGTQIEVPLNTPVEIKDIDSVGVVAVAPEVSP